MHGPMNIKFVNILTKVKGKLKWSMRVTMRFILFCFFLMLSKTLSM